MYDLRSNFIMDSAGYWRQPFFPIVFKTLDEIQILQARSRS